MPREYNMIKKKKTVGSLCTGTHRCPGPEETGSAWGRAGAEALDAEITKSTVCGGNRVNLGRHRTGVGGEIRPYRQGDGNLSKKVWWGWRSRLKKSGWGQVRRKWKPSPWTSPGWEPP